MPISSTLCLYYSSGTISTRSPTNRRSAISSLPGGTFTMSPRLQKSSRLQTTSSWSIAMTADARYNFFASLDDHGQQEIRHVRVEQSLQEELNGVLKTQGDDLID